MRILWVSSIAWKTISGYPYPVNGAGAVSGSLFQQSMIEGLEQLGHTVDIVSEYPYVSGSNTHQDLNWKHRDDAEDIAVKTIDIPYYSLIHKASSLKKAVKKKLDENKYDIAVAYLIHQPFMSAISHAKRLDPQIKTVLICPDLPDMMDMSLSQKKLKSFLKKIDKKRIERLYKKIDGFVLFAKAMQEKITNQNARFTVIEGVASVEDLDIKPVNKETFIMYAGTLHKNIGIENIIDSIEFIDDTDTKLKIYGTGELEEYIKERASESSRIVYGGFIDRNELFEEQKKAIALVNARNPEDEYTKYSFPSKTFEYLYSGTPFVTTKLIGVPDEYSKYLFEIDNNTPKTIARAINQIAKTNKDDILSKCANAREFVINNKNGINQTKKMENFLNFLIKENIDEPFNKEREN